MQKLGRARPREVRGGATANARQWTRSLSRLARLITDDRDFWLWIREEQNGDGGLANPFSTVSQRVEANTDERSTSNIQRPTFKWPGDTLPGGAGAVNPSGAA